MTDQHGLETHLEYNSEGYATRVTEPFGRWFKLNYDGIAYDRGHFDLVLAKIASQPSAGQWIELPVSTEFRDTSFRWLRLRGADGRALAVTEIEFYASGNGQRLSGRAYGRADQPANAFDRQNDTIFKSGDYTNWVALDLGVGRAAKIDRVRVLPAQGSEELLKGAVVEGLAVESVTRPVLTEVVSSDGQTVNYTYEAKTFEDTPTQTIALIGARHGDGTVARYDYAFTPASPSRPMLVEADDPHYDGNAKQIRYSYHDRPGMIHKEINPVTGGVYASLELDPADPSKRYVHYSDLRTVSFKMSDQAGGRALEYVDSVGRKTRFEYADEGRGRLAARIDHMGRRKEIAYDNHGRVGEIRRGRDVRVRTIRDGQGRVVKKTDHRGRVTSFERDTLGRVTKQVTPKGLVREATYNNFGQITTFVSNGEINRIEYDSHGRKTAWVDARGNTARYTYDSKGRRVGITDALGRTTRREINSRGLTSKIVAPDGTETQISYDSYGRKTAETDSKGRKTQYEYDALGRVVRTVDFRGGVTTFDYTELPNGCGACSLVPSPSRVVYPDGRVTENLYDAAGRLLCRTENAGTPAQASTTLTYDEQNNVIAIADPLGRITRYTYDEEGHRLSATDALGRTTLYSYNVDGNLVSTTAPDGSITRSEYDANDRLIKTIDAAGNVTRYDYDALGNITQVIDALGRKTRYEYDGKRRTATIYPDGTRQTWEYDALGRPVKDVSVDGVVTAMTYDNGGRMLTQTTVMNGQRSLVVNTYDALGRRLSAADALGLTTRWTYDARSNVLAMIRPDGLQTTNTYDDKDRLTSTTDPLGQITQYAYDVANNLDSLTDARGNTYRFTYDAAHRKTAMIYPDGSKETWVYDLAGQLIAYANRSGQTKSIAYNAVGQPVSENWAQVVATAGAPVLAPNVAYDYDATGRLTTVATVAPSHQTISRLSYTYDEFGGLVSETTDLSILVPGLAPETVGYRYDELGRRSKLIYPDDSMVDFRYDGRGRLATIDTNGKGRDSVLAAYSYDPRGRIAQLTRDNGIATSYQYDVAGQLTDIAHTKGSETLAASHYQLDQLGRRTEQTREDNITERYAYDATGQLIGVDYGAGKTESFAYDATGNRTEVGRVSPNAPLVRENYQSNALNQYTEVNNVAFTYDPNGNLVNDGHFDFVYDSLNRLLSVTTASSAVKNPVRTEFTYDVRSRCVLRKYYTKTAQGQWVINQSDSRALTYDLAWNLLSERKLNGQQAGKYIYGQRTDEIITARVSNSSNHKSETIYPLTDGLGSTVALTTPNGKVAERYRYSAYGTPRALTSDFRPLASGSDYRFLFTGREWLAGVQLNDHRNRYYSPGLGRWPSTDPIQFDAGDTNLYRYVLNVPIDLSDPYGQNPVVIVIPAAALYAAAAAAGISVVACAASPDCRAAAAAIAERMAQCTAEAARCVCDKMVQPKPRLWLEQAMLGLLRGMHERRTVALLQMPLIMSLQIQYKNNSWVADGDGIALTVFLNNEAAFLSLTAANLKDNGDCEYRIWVEALPLEKGHLLVVNLVDDVKATAPISIRVEEAATRERMKREYSAKTIGISGPSGERKP